MNRKKRIQSVVYTNRFGFFMLFVDACNKASVYLPAVRWMCRLE
ncbi:hypothetical protein QSI_2700 [Clostridioides difficile P28]|nr:hypothetical protein QSI_2700 [Clostridioides difficile P28]